MKVKKKPRGKVNRREWTAEEVEVVRRMWPDHTAVEISPVLNRQIASIFGMARRLGLQKSDEYIKRDRERRSERVKLIPKPGRFKEGRVPWNKGKKMPFNPNSAANRFQPGHVPKTKKPIGSTRISKDGYLQIKVAETGRQNIDWRGKHNLLWEEHHGKIPKGFYVNMIDGDKENITIENLYLVSRADMLRKVSLHNYPKEVAQLYQLKGVLTKSIQRKEKV